MNGHQRKAARRRARRRWREEARAREAERELRKARQSETNRRYRARHPETAREATRKWWQANREHVREYQRAYRAANPEFAARARDQNRRWREENPEKAREGRDRAIARTRARKWVEQGKCYRDYAAYLADRPSGVPMSETNFKYTLEAFWRLALAPTAGVCDDGCLAGFCVDLTDRKHPVWGPGWSRHDGSLNLYRPGKAWLPEIQVLAGLVRRVLVAPEEARPVGEGEERAVAWLYAAGLLKEHHGKTTVTDDGMRLVAACGGLSPKGVHWRIEELPECFERVGACPRGR